MGRFFLLFGILIQWLSMEFFADVWLDRLVLLLVEMVFCIYSPHQFVIFNA